MYLYQLISAEILKLKFLAQSLQNNTTMIITSCLFLFFSSLLSYIMPSYIKTDFFAACACKHSKLNRLNVYFSLFWMKIFYFQLILNIDKLKFRIAYFKIHIQQFRKSFYLANDIDFALHSFRTYISFVEKSWQVTNIPG